MEADIDDYVMICPTYKSYKGTREKWYGIISVLETPEGLQMHMATAFITLLQLSLDFYLISVIIIRYTKV